jgi:hypothetical protein
MNWNKIFPTHISFMTIGGGTAWIIAGVIGMAPPQAYLLGAIAYGFAYFDILHHYQRREK